MLKILFEQPPDQSGGGFLLRAVLAPSCTRGYHWFIAFGDMGICVVGLPRWRGLGGGKKERYFSLFPPFSPSFLQKKLKKRTYIKKCIFVR